MKKSIKFPVLIIFNLLWINQIFAQSGRELNRSNITRLYNSSTVETITGKIIKIDTVQSGYGRFPGILMSLQIKKQETEVYIAPLWYLSDQQLQFKTGNPITITGSRVTYKGKHLIITSEINYNKKTIMIRNEKGIPVWAGRRMGPGQGRRGRR